MSNIFQKWRKKRKRAKMMAQNGKLSQDVGIPVDLKAIVKPEDVDFLTQSAMDDACKPGNPKDPSFEDIKNLYLSLM